MARSATTPGKLQPEYERAVKELLKHLETSPVCTNEISETVAYVSGTFQLFGKRIATKTIPSGKSWRWNQTNARKEIFLAADNLSVKVLKLIPRKRNMVSSERIPSLKIWQYEVISPNKTYFAIWCEKGYDRTKEPKEVAVSLELADLSFLSCWMEPSLANSFWPRG
mmetsp:Transcript_117959/g.176238  ORF Transcript_117959/g.176238 Transcript_117959/m.176238 type:complete len:167 (-) Transcript_117959:58-558(-)